MKDLRSSILEIGSNLVKCPFKCDGISNAPYKGIIPRCYTLKKKIEMERKAVLLLV